MSLIKDKSRLFSRAYEEKREIFNNVRDGFSEDLFYYCLFKEGFGEPWFPDLKLKQIKEIIIYLFVLGILFGLNRFICYNFY